MRTPEVYNSITAIAGELTNIGIPKNRTNMEGGYQYRSIDDVLATLSPLLAKHRLCVLPRALESTMTERSGLQNTLLVSVHLKIAFDLVSAEDASIHTVMAYGEALDDSDKATAKATSAAYKSAMLQTFCIPITDTPNPDAKQLKLRRDHEPAPPEGWDNWVVEVTAIIAACESGEALERVQNGKRSMLTALSRERSDLYNQLGDAFHRQRAMLSNRGEAQPTSAHKIKRKRVARAVERDRG